MEASVRGAKSGEESNMMVDQIEKAEVAETKRCRWSIRGISGK